VNKPLTMFHIWSGPTMPAEFRANIEANHGFLREGDRHVLISDETVSGCEQISYSDYKKTILEDDEFNRLFADQMVMNGRYEWLPRETAESDFVRLHYALKNPGVIYSDCDNRFTGVLPELDESYSWFGSNGSNLDVFGFVDFGIGVMDEIMKTIKNTSAVQLCPISYMVVSYLATIGKDKVRELSSDLFVHGK
jgi:hypothetical protein